MPAQEGAARDQRAMVSAGLLSAMSISHEQAELCAGPLNTACARYEIDTRLRVAAFLAQVAHESARFTRLEENLNYSAERLRQIFPTKFPTIDDAQQYARNPERIANRVYANRIGNGDEASGDGWWFKGRGLMQITGRANYTACADALRLPLLTQPYLLTVPINAALSAAWFWRSRGLNALADAGNIQAITRVINGGLNGLTERQALYALARGAMV